jgi:uncharacterized protein involved in type VI secretion and phage assembly
VNRTRPIYDLASQFSEQIQTAEGESSKVYETLIGVVTDNKDPSKLGRVKVKLPILSESETTFWVPIVMPGAGKNRGWFFIPEPEDEVLVIFEHGDLNRPLIIGSLWNGKDTPPSDNKNGKNDARMIKSRQGSKVTFDDSENPNIVIEDGTGKGKITLDTKNNKIIIEAIEGDVCFQSPTGDMTIIAKAMELKATENVEVHAGSTMAWGSDTSVKINGSTGVTTSGSTSNPNCGNSSSPQAPTADPQDIADPYGS